MGDLKIYEPPKCPYCRANLFRVLETNYLTYEFDSSSGRYEDVDGEAEIKCPECNADLYDVFPNGVCNFKVKSKASSSSLK